MRAYLKGRWRLALAVFLFLGAEGWPRCQGKGGSRCLSVDGFYGFIFCQGEARKKKRYDAGAFIAYSCGRPLTF